MHGEKPCGRSSLQEAGNRYAKSLLLPEVSFRLSSFATRQLVGLFQL
ncbi:hypothetical protein ADIS_4858 [Lunatimonas lonarensis]|uniref:Uncharacterized protein n=1 Tax=Lunatimonas lonarensis TaxID=1232681 RepID=R7ZKZ5_9BACT|nr:hypothetical protein ADIS_4858 [Lunatimonas lonarensis]